MTENNSAAIFAIGLGRVVAASGEALRRGVHPRVESARRVSLARERASFVEALQRLGASGPVAGAIAAIVEGGGLRPEDAVETASNPRAQLVGDEVIIWSNDGVGYSLWGHPVYW